MNKLVLDSNTQFLNKDNYELIVNDRKNRGHMNETFYFGNVQKPYTSTIHHITYHKSNQEVKQSLEKSSSNPCPPPRLGPQSLDVLTRLWRNNIKRGSFQGSILDFEERKLLVCNMQIFYVYENKQIVEYLRTR